jgi:predicted nucleic acid-binding protein
VLYGKEALLKKISASEAAESHAEFLAVGLNLHPAPSLVGAALKLAAQEHHSPYDMLYVVLALQLGCEFITADKIVVNNGE